MSELQQIEVREVPVYLKFVPSEHHKGGMNVMLDPEKRGTNRLIKPAETVALPVNVARQLLNDYPGNYIVVEGSELENFLKRQDAEREEIRLKSEQEREEAQQRLAEAQDMAAGHTYPCPYPGCGKEYKRSQTMINHFERVHYSETAKRVKEAKEVKE